MPVLYRAIAVLYRAIDSRGRTIDFYLSSSRNSKAAYRFLSKILHNVTGWQIPHLINTVKVPTYGRAVALLKREGRCSPFINSLDCFNSINELD